MRWVAELGKGAEGSIQKVKFELSLRLGGGGQGKREEEAYVGGGEI